MVLHPSRKRKSADPALGLDQDFTVKKFFVPVAPHLFKFISKKYQNKPITSSDGYSMIFATMVQHLSLIESDLFQCAGENRIEFNLSMTECNWLGGPYLIPRSYIAIEAAAHREFIEAFRKQVEQHIPPGKRYYKKVVNKQARIFLDYYKITEDEYGELQLCQMFYKRKSVNESTPISGLL